MRKILWLSVGSVIIISVFIAASRSNSLIPGQKPPWIVFSFAGENENNDIATLVVKKGRFFAQIASAFGVGYEEILKILDAAKNSYNLDKIVEGREMSFISEKNTGALIGLVYQIDSERALVLEKNSSGTWEGKNLPIPYEVKTEEIEGAIDSSLFEAIVGAGGDERIALALAEMFAWQIDFTTDIRTGDSFRAVYEKKHLNENYISPGNILAAKFVNDGKEFSGVRFSGSDGASTSASATRASSEPQPNSSAPNGSAQAKSGYYDLNGLSLQKIFLKSPLSYKYISSGFSYDRLNPVTRTDWGPHRAIDYAADYGTPAVTVGDGTITSSGWNGGLGIAVSIRHNDTYTTVYGHLSRAAVGTGTRVKQGQIIGYVGTTGDATGPHLHFEMRKFGTRVNPLVIELPPGDPIAETDKAEFNKTLEKFREFFNN